MKEAVLLQGENVGQHPCPAFLHDEVFSCPELSSPAVLLVHRVAAERLCLGWWSWG